VLSNYSQKWLGFTGIVLLSFGCYIDYTAVNVALPTLQQEFHVSLIQLQWIMNICFLALCILATIMGHCGDLYGRRRVFYIGVSIFAIASLIAGSADTFAWLFSGRLLQGIGTAIVLPLGPSLLTEIFPERERGRAIAWFGSLGGVALAFGPVLGGMIVAWYGWRWIFFINVPIILLGYLFCCKSIKKSVVTSIKHKLDWTGMLLLGLTIAGIVMSLINSQHLGWSDKSSLAYLITGIISAVLLIKLERNKKNPLIDFRDFANIKFYAGAMLCLLGGILSAVVLFFDPLYLQVIQEQSPAFSGLVLFAIPASLFVIAFLAGRFIHQSDIINAIILGMASAILACLLQVFFTTETPLWYIIIAFICLGCTWGICNTVPVIAAQAAVGEHRVSTATGTMVTMFNIGGSIGLSAAVIIYHFVASRKLSDNFPLQIQQHIPDHVSQLQKLIANPAQSMQIHENMALHSIFNEIFMQGFTGVMCFLLSLSILLLLNILIFRANSLKYDLAAKQYPLP